MRVLSFEAVGMEMAMPEVVEMNQMAARVQISRHAGLGPLNELASRLVF
jgi:hypothetical protein